MGNAYKFSALILSVCFAQGIHQTQDAQTIPPPTKTTTLHSDTLSPHSAEETTPSYLSASDYEKEIILEDWLKLNIPSDRIVHKLWAPVRKGKIEESGNTGVLTQVWEYPQYGLSLWMDVNPSIHIVQLYGIEAVYPCTMKTPRHTGIGSSLSQLQQQYPQGKYSNNYFSIGNPYDICLYFKITADTVTKISIWQDFD